MMRWHPAHDLKATSLVVILSALLFTVSQDAVASTSSNLPNRHPVAVKVKEMTLEQCLEVAMENNHRRPASRFAVAMAEAQHRQALASYWPQLTLRGGYQRLDEAPDFVFPASQLNIPSQSIKVSGGTAFVTIPTGTFGNPAPIQLPVTYPGQTITTKAQHFTIPRQDVKLMDPNSFTASLQAKWLLYGGGMRRGLRQQTGGWLKMAEQDSRRTDLQIIDSVKQLYYGAVLARQLYQLGQDTLARMQATLNLTKTMYQTGSGKVKKTDYLDNKIVVETLRSTVALLERNQQMAQAALANTMGLPWQESIRPSASKVPFRPYGGDLQDLVASAYQFSPDWAKLKAGIMAAKGAVQTAKSGFFPKLAITGELHKWWNDYNAGLATDQNKEGWSVGVGIKIPIFNGFLTRNQVREARAQVSKLKQERFILKEGIGLQVRNIFLGLNATRKSYHATFDAMRTAEQDSDLNTRAYENGLVKTEKVIRAQLAQALMSAQYYRVCYDHMALQSQLDLVVGTEVVNQLQGNPHPPGRSEAKTEPILATYLKK